MLKKTYVVITDRTYTTEAESSMKAFSNIIYRMVSAYIAENKLDDSHRKRLTALFRREFSGAAVMEKDTLKIGVVGTGNPKEDLASKDTLLKELGSALTFGISAIYVPEQEGLADIARSFAHKWRVPVIQLQEDPFSDKPFIRNSSRIVEECERIYITLTTRDFYSPEMLYVSYRLQAKNQLAKLRRV